MPFSACKLAATFVLDNDPLPTTKISWAYTAEEEAKNGHKELSWD